MSPPEPNAELVRVARLGVSDEYSDHILYAKLASTVREGGEFNSVLKALSDTELGHFNFWKRYVPDYEPRVGRLLIYFVLFLRKFFGLTFTVRYLDRHEAAVIKQYRSVADLIPASDKAEFDKMLGDEISHEKEFSHRIESSAVRYIAFVVLGLADALVEITGIHAGSLGIYDSTEIAGLAGIVAGGAASLAMASAAFAQAKQGFEGSARLSAVYTGISYFVTAVILATPYFLTKDMVGALAISLSLALLIVVFITYYSSVVLSKPFTKDFLQTTGIVLGVTAALYLFGYAVRLATGITI